MEVEDSHIKCKQKTAETEKILDYDYKKCAGCTVCVVLCPKQALQEGPLKEIATGLDAPPILIDVDACVFLWNVRQFLPSSSFQDESDGEGEGT